MMLMRISISTSYVTIYTNYNKGSETMTGLKNGFARNIRIILFPVAHVNWAHSNWDDRSVFVSFNVSASTVTCTEP